MLDTDQLKRIQKDSQRTTLLILELKLLQTEYNLRLKLVHSKVAKSELPKQNLCSYRIQSMQELEIGLIDRVMLVGTMRVNI